MSISSANLDDVLDSLVSSTTPYLVVEGGNSRSIRPIPTFVDSVTHLVRLWEAPSSEIRRRICQRLFSDSVKSPSRTIVDNITEWLDYRVEESRHDNVTFSLVLLLRVSSTALGDCFSESPDINLVQSTLILLNRLGENILLLSVRLGTPNGVNAAFRFCSIAFCLSNFCNSYDERLDEEYGILIRLLILIPMRFPSKVVINESHCAFQIFRERNQRFASEAYRRSIDYIHLSVSCDVLKFLFTVARDSAVSANQNTIHGRNESLASKKYPFNVLINPLSVIVDALCGLCNDQIDRTFTRHLATFDQGLCSINNIMVMGKVDVSIQARSIIKICKAAFVEAQTLANTIDTINNKTTFMSDILPLFGTSLRVLSLLCEDDHVGLSCSQAIIFDFNVLGLIQTMLDKTFVTITCFSIVSLPTADIFTKHLLNLFTALCMSGIFVVDDKCVSVLNEILALLITALKNSQKLQKETYEPLPSFLYTLLGGFISKLIFASTMNPIFSSIKARALELGAILEELFEEPD